MNAPARDALATTNFDEEVWLLGQPPLQKFLNYVEETAIGGDRVKQSLLVDQWRAANDVYYELENSEAGIAETAEAMDLDPALAELADRVRADSRFKRAFEVVPTRFAMVELDKLIISQQHVNVTHARSAKARLAKSSTPADVFRLCAPIDAPAAPVRIRQTGARRYVMWSPSSDIRFHEAKLFSGDAINGYEPYGAIGAILGLVVGFGSNFLNVIESDGRLVLNNGHHRAYGLRDFGLTHAPCIIQTVTRTDELNLIGPRQVCEAPAFYFKAARPPLLKDFFDPRLHTVLRIPKLVRMIEINFEVRDFEVEDFAADG